MFGAGGRTEHLKTSVHGIEKEARTAGTKGVNADYGLVPDLGSTVGCNGCGSRVDRSLCLISQLVQHRFFGETAVAKRCRNKSGQASSSSVACRITGRYLIPPPANGERRENEHGLLCELYLVSCDFSEKRWSAYRNTPDRVLYLAYRYGKCKTKMHSGPRHRDPSACGFSQGAWCCSAPCHFKCDIVAFRRAEGRGARVL